MPCGGIWPATSEIKKYFNEHPEHDCFLCGKNVEEKDLMWCEEWDAYLHRACVVPFLETEEGQIVLKHGHQVILYFEYVAYLKDEDAKPEQ